MKIKRQDITYVPERTQQQNIEEAFAAEIECEEVYGNASVASSDVPKTITIERAIKYYESHATGEFEVLYHMTAKWLRQSLGNTDVNSVSHRSNNVEQFFEKVADAYEDRGRDENENEN